MKGLTLYPARATLVAIGAKQIETRPWPTDYRGEVAIHASRDEPPQETTATRHPAFIDKLRPAGFVMSKSPVAHRCWNVPAGAIVAVVRIADCIRVETLEQTPISVYEYIFGDYTPGRWAFRLADVRRLRTPVRCNGQQRFWELPADVLRAVERSRRPARQEE